VKPLTAFERGRETEIQNYDPFKTTPAGLVLNGFNLITGDYCAALITILMVSPQPQEAGKCNS